MAAVLTTSLREPEGLKYHGMAVAYAVFGYAVGFYGLFDASWAINALATVLLGHSMVIAAYLLHECGHNTIFRKQSANTRLGRAMSWICGAAYGRYEDMRYKHFRHHVDNDDIAWFDYEEFFRQHPLTLRITKILEWFYIPAHDLLMHGIMMFTSFVIPQRRNQRARNIAVIAIRCSIFAVLMMLAPRVALLYAIAYMMMMTVLRFMDSLQHDYSYNLVLFDGTPGQRRGDFEWEQAHTFSNPHSLKYDWPNWFTLNFGFHNAHHSDPTVPWYRLPALHRSLCGDDPATVIPLWSQLKVFHKYRVARVVHDSADLGGRAYPQGKGYLRAAQEARISGGNAASFLTAF